MKNNQKEIINLSSLSCLEKLKNNEIKNEIINKTEDNIDKQQLFPKMTLKKENNNSNNIILNQKRERSQNNNNKINKDMEEDNNNMEDKNCNYTICKKKSVAEAKKEMKDFELLILNTEKELQNKYGFIFPDLSFEDNLPDEIKNKLMDDFLENPKIKKILNEAMLNNK